MTYGPEKIGEFKLWPPMPGHDEDGWGLSDGSGWLPVMLADRDACLALIVMLDNGLPYAALIELQDKYNCADPTVDVTTEHLAAYVKENPA